MVFLKGKHVKNNYHISRSEIIDMAPTILYLLGTSIPKDMDGKVLQEVIDKDYFESNPPQYMEPNDISSGDIIPSGDYSSDEAEEIEGRLRGLGYI